VTSSIEQSIVNANDSLLRLETVVPIMLIYNAILWNCGSALLLVKDLRLQQSLSVSTIELLPYEIVIACHTPQILGDVQLLLKRLIDHLVSFAPQFLIVLYYSFFS